MQIIRLYSCLLVQQMVFNILVQSQDIFPYSGLKLFHLCDASWWIDCSVVSLSIHLCFVGFIAIEMNLYSSRYVSWRHYTLFDELISRINIWVSHAFHLKLSFITRWPVVDRRSNPHFGESKALWDLHAVVIFFILPVAGYSSLGVIEGGILLMIGFLGCVLSIILLNHRVVNYGWG